MAYSCHHPGCGKEFVRPEHLYRHRLNHNPKRIHACSTCQKTFVRPDLLRRHERRHRGGARGVNNANIVQTPDNGNTLHGCVDPTMDPSISTDLMMGGNLPEDGTHEPPGNPTTIGTSVDLDDHENAVTLTDVSFSGADHMLFDSSFDIQAQNDDLDWLFSTFTADDTSFDPHASNILSVSPESTTLQQTPADENTTAVGTWSEVRNKMLTALHQLPSDVQQSSFFEPNNLNIFFNLYFDNYHPHFPILHRPSLEPTRTPALLLAAVITLGATLSPDPEHFHQTQQVHDNLRWLIFSSDAFCPPAPLWCLQALLLVQAHGKMFSSRKHHEMAHVFHASLITLMRRGSSYNNDPHETLTDSSLEKAWHEWIERESSKRASFFAFIMDAQHSSVFGHVPALSISDMRLTLPCSERLWDAMNASSWELKRTRTTGNDEFVFLQTLRALLSRQPLPQGLSPFARFCVLHGLFSVTKHMQMRDVMASDMDTEIITCTDEDTDTAGVARWYDTLDRAIETWSLSLLSRQPSLCLEAARPLQRIAHISIHINLTDFHVLAGAPSLTGNKVYSLEVERVQSRLLQWANGSQAARTLSHCLLLIQEIMFARQRYRAADDNIALRPWCLYHATLILWAYGTLTRHTSQAATFLSAEDYVVRMLNELMGGSAQPSVAHGTAGLISAVCDALEDCKWELLQEAKSTLAQLILQH